MQPDKVSLIVPIYNVAPYLPRCLDSLDAQTYENLEILLVDDCSTDGGDVIAKEYAQQRPQRFRFIRRAENGGLSAARNTALEYADGEWLAFADSDDWLDPEYISAMHEVAVRDGADIVMSSWYHYFPDTGQLAVISPFLDLTTKSSQGEKVAYSEPSATARLFRRSLFDESGLRFPTNVRRAAEQGIIIPLLTRTDKISILDRPLYYYYQRKNSNSKQYGRGVDVSFFPITVRNVEENACAGFESELEYRAIADILYGMVMIMVRSGRPRREIVREVDRFVKEHPNWKKNPYLPRMPRAKRIFAAFAGMKFTLALRLFVFAWDVLGKKIRIWCGRSRA